MNHESFVRLIRLLNESVFRPALWSEAMDEFCRLVGASSAIASKRVVEDDFQIESNFHLHSCGIDDRILKRYLLDFGSSELPAVRRLEDWGSRMGPGVVMDDTVTFGREHLTTHPSMEALKDIFGCFRRAAVTLRTHDIGQDFLFVQFPKDLPEISEDSRRLISKLSPIVADSVRLSRLWDESQIRSTLGWITLESISSPLAVINTNRDIVFHNESMREAFETGAPFSIGSGGRLFCSDNKTNQLIMAWLQSLRDDEHEVEPFSHAIKSAGGLIKWVVDMVPLSLPGQPRNHVFLCFEDASRPLGIDRGYAITRFKLTAAECCIAQCLIQGMSVDEIVSHRRTSRNTIKSQIRSVLRKT